MNKIESILKEALEKIQMEKDESSLNIEKERLEVEKRKLEIEEKRLILEEKREENQEKRHNELLKTLKVLTGIETSSNHLNLEEITDHLKDEDGNKVELEEVVITKGEEPKFDEIKKEDKQNKKRNSKKIEVQEETKIEEVKAEEPKEKEKTLEQMQKELGFPTTQSLFPVEKKEEKPRPVSFTSMIGKMKEDMVEVNKKIESGELVTGVEKVELYDEPEDEKKDVVDMNLGADSNLKPFAIVPEETKVAANEVVDEFLAKMNKGMDEAEIKEEGNIEESKEIQETVVEEVIEKDETKTEILEEIQESNFDKFLEKEQEPLATEEIYDPRSEEEERLIQQKIEEIKIKVNAFIGKIPNLETVPALVYRKLALDVKDDYGVEEALYALKVKGAIQRYDEAEKLRKETEEKRIIDEHRTKGFDLFAPPIDFNHIEGVTNADTTPEIKITGLNDERAEKVKTLLKGRTSDIFTIFNGEIKLIENETKEYLGEILHRTEYLKPMKITDVNGTEQTIPKGARGGFVSKEAIIGPSVVIYPATLILKGAVVEEGTVFGRLDINSPIVVKQNQYIDKGVYLALENVMNKEVLNYKVD
jgi:hypothetical protein